eukprot:4095016-Prymnesium_polylepis.3
MLKDGTREWRLVEWRLDAQTVQTEEVQFTGPAKDLGSGTGASDRHHVRPGMGQLENNLYAPVNAW